MEKKVKTDETALKAAKRYVDQQLETMKRFGSAPALTRSDYDALVRKVLAAAQ